MAKLVEAAYAGDEVAVAQLINAGANIDELDDNGLAVLIGALINGHISVCNILLDAAANVGVRGPSGITSLMVAAERGYAEIVERLLIAGADVNQADSTGLTALMFAAAHGREPVVSQLLAAGADPHLAATAGDWTDWTALMVAASEDQVQICRQLLDCGANIDQCTGRGRTALMAAAALGAEAAVAFLIEVGASLGQIDDQGQTALSYAVFNGRENESALLISAGADLDQADEFGRNPLILAAREGDERVVAFLISAGANVNYKGHDETPLISAADAGHEAVVALLLTAGADVDHPCPDTALLRAATKGHEGIVDLLLGADADVNYSGRDTALSRAAQFGHEGVVRRLIAAGADLDRFGAGAYIEAIERGHILAAEALLSAGVNVDTKDNSDRTALMLAVENGDDAVVALLLTKGTDVNCIDGLGASALIKAAERNHLAIIQMLLASGADVDQADAVGRTPLIAASQFGHDDALSLLLSAHAALNERAGDERWWDLKRAFMSFPHAVRKGPLGPTGIIWAAAQGFLPVVRSLVAAGADIDCADSDGHTALTMAAACGHALIVEFLLSQGEKLSADSWGRGPAQLAREAGQSQAADALHHPSLDGTLRTTEETTCLIPEIHLHANAGRRTSTNPVDRVSIFRGLRFAACRREEVIAAHSRGEFISEDSGTYPFIRFSGQDVAELSRKARLNTIDTRPDNVQNDGWVFACGDLMGAEHYAFYHGGGLEAKEIGLVLKIELDLSGLVVDGRDSLHSLAVRSAHEPGWRSVIDSMYGPHCLYSLDKATPKAASEICARVDLACQDLRVVKFHLANTNVFGGRWGTLYRSAFMFRPNECRARVLRAWTPMHRQPRPVPDFCF